LESTAPLLTMLETMIRLSGDPLLSSSNDLDNGLEFVGADIFQEFLGALSDNFSRTNRATNAK
jgi:hypothetical protein